MESKNHGAALTKTSSNSALSTLKGLAALTAALGTFMPYAALGYTAAPYKLLGKKTPNFHRRIAGKCAHMITQIAHRKILGIRTEINGTLPEIDPKNERYVYLANHPTNNGLPALMEFASQNFGEYLVAISKKENLYHPTAPLNFWPLHFMSSILYIDRQGGAETIQKIRQNCHELLTANTGLLIFPDRRRPTRAAIEESINARGKLTAPDMPQYTRSPDAGGSWAIIQGLREDTNSQLHTRFIDITSAFNQSDETLADAGNLSGSTLHFQAQDITSNIEKIEERQNFEAFLNELWLDKNRQIHQWKSESSPAT